jgi:L-histidine N-alpha-methyltransferase
MRSRFGELQTQTARRTRRDAGFVLDVLLGPEQRRSSLRDDVAQGLRREPKMMPSKWLYDERGIALFEEITRLDEYYLTPAETGILQLHSTDIAQATRAETLVDLGAGRCTKARVLVDALRDEAPVRTFVPFDF